MKKNNLPLYFFSNKIISNVSKEQLPKMVKSSLLSTKELLPLEYVKPISNFKK